MLVTFLRWTSKLKVFRTNKVPLSKLLVLSIDCLYATIKALTKCFSQSVFPTLFFSGLNYGFFFHMSIRTEIFVIFVKCLIGYVVFLNKYPFFCQENKCEKQFWIKNKLGFKIYFLWYKITQEFENLIFFP